MRLAVGVEHRAQVLGHRDAGHRDRVLERHEQTHAGALVGLRLGDVLTAEQNLSFGHLEIRVAHDRVSERRLARTVGTHQGVNLTLVDGEVKSLEDRLIAGTDMKIADF